MGAELPATYMRVRSRSSSCNGTGCRPRGKDNSHKRLQSWRLRSQCRINMMEKACASTSLQKCTHYAGTAAEGHCRHRPHVRARLTGLASQRLSQDVLWTCCCNLHVAVCHRSVLGVSLCLIHLECHTPPCYMRQRLLLTLHAIRSSPFLGYRRSRVSGVYGGTWPTLPPEQRVTTYQRQTLVLLQVVCATRSTVVRSLQQERISAAGITLKVKAAVQEQA